MEQDEIESALYKLDIDALRDIAELCDALMVEYEEEAYTRREYIEQVGRDFANAKGDI